MNDKDKMTLQRTQVMFLNAAQLAVIRIFSTRDRLYRLLTVRKGAIFKTPTRTVARTTQTFH